MTDILLYDLAYHYDALSILYVKLEAGSSPTVSTSIARFETALSHWVGQEKHNQIMVSPEYKRMVEVNHQLFNAFEWLHGVGLTASAEEVKAQAIETDRINGVDRPAAKRALQERWFPDQKLMEVKVGYGEGGK
jgi:hypothetical protein